MVKGSSAHPRPGVQREQDLSGLRFATADGTHLPTKLERAPRYLPMVFLRDKADEMLSQSAGFERYETSAYSISVIICKALPWSDAGEMWRIESSSLPHGLH